jgi:hypothetical protein
MSEAGKRLKYELPRGEVMVRIIMRNIYENLRQGNAAKVSMAPLVQRAYTIVKETGVMPVKDYGADTVFLEKQ